MKQKDLSQKLKEFWNFNRYKAESFFDYVLPAAIIGSVGAGLTSCGTTQKIVDKNNINISQSSDTIPINIVYKVPVGKVDKVFDNKTITDEIKEMYKQNGIESFVADTIEVINGKAHIKGRATFSKDMPDNIVTNPDKVYEFIGRGIEECDTCGNDEPINPIKNNDKKGFFWGAPKASVYSTEGMDKKEHRVNTSAMFGREGKKGNSIFIYGGKTFGGPITLLYDENIYKNQIIGPLERTVSVKTDSVVDKQNMQFDLNGGIGFKGKGGLIITLGATKANLYTATETHTTSDNKFYYPSWDFKEKNNNCSLGLTDLLEKNNAVYFLDVGFGFEGKKGFGFDFHLGTPLNSNPSSAYGSIGIHKTIPFKRKGNRHK